MQVPFKYYLHDNRSRTEVVEAMLDAFEAEGVFPPSEMTAEDLVELIGRPFYEVELDCVFDTDTGRVTIIGAKG